MKLFLLVSVIQNGRNIVKEAANSIDDNGTFADLLKEVLNSANLPDMNVMVDFQCINSPIWHVISKGIEEDLAIKKIQLPAVRENTNNINKLYNHLLDILRSKDLGWHIVSTSNIGKSFVDRLTNLLCDIAKLYDSIEKYTKYLENVNQRMHYIHASLLPVRNGIDNIKVEDIKASPTIASEYEEFNHLMQETELYVPVCLNEFIPKNKIEQFDFFDKFQLK
ncbi:12198_t:CDS:2, partial [Funneliformis caledonium]